MLWAWRGGLCNWDMGMGAWGMAHEDDARCVVSNLRGCKEGRLRGIITALLYSLSAVHSECHRKALFNFWAFLCHPFTAGFWKEKIKWELKNEAQAEVVVAAGRRAEVPTRHTTEPGVVAPAAPTIHAENARRWSFRIGLGRTAVITIPILTPFPHITAHIIDAQAVWRLGCNIVGFTTTVIIIPCHIADIIASSIFGTAATPTTGGIFPLSLGGQTEVLASFRIQMGDESLAIVPRNHLHWELVTSEA